MDNGHALCTAVEWCQAGGQVRVLAMVYCWEPKIGQQKVQLYYEDDPLCPSSYYVFFIFDGERESGAGGEEKGEREWEGVGGIVWGSFFKRYKAKKANLCLFLTV